MFNERQPSMQLASPQAWHKYKMALWHFQLAVHMYHAHMKPSFLFHKSSEIAYDGLFGVHFLYTDFQEVLNLELCA